MDDEFEIDNDLSDAVSGSGSDPRGAASTSGAADPERASAIRQASPSTLAALARQHLAVLDPESIEAALIDRLSTLSLRPSVHEDVEASDPISRNLLRSTMMEAADMLESGAMNRASITALLRDAAQADVSFLDDDDVEIDFDAPADAGIGEAGLALLGIRRAASTPPKPVSFCGSPDVDALLLRAVTERDALSAAMISGAGVDPDAQAQFRKTLKALSAVIDGRLA